MLLILNPCRIDKISNSFHRRHFKNTILRSGRQSVFLGMRLAIEEAHAMYPRCYLYIYVLTWIRSWPHHIQFSMLAIHLLIGAIQPIPLCADFLFYAYLPFAQIDLILSFFSCASPLVFACLFSVLLVCLYLFSPYRPFNLLFLRSFLLKKVTHI